MRTSVFAPSLSWSFWNVGVPRCWSSVPAASRVAGGDIGTESRRGRGRPPCSSRQVGVGPWAHGPCSRPAGRPRCSRYQRLHTHPKMFPLKPCSLSPHIPKVTSVPASRRWSHIPMVCRDSTLLSTLLKNSLQFSGNQVTNKGALLVVEIKKLPLTLLSDLDSCLYHLPFPL